MTTVIHETDWRFWFWLLVVSFVCLQAMFYATWIVLKVTFLFVIKLAFLCVLALTFLGFFCLYEAVIHLAR